MQQFPAARKGVIKVRHLHMTHRLPLLTGRSAERAPGPGRD
jgi:hypothetical protein